MSDRSEPYGSGVWGLVSPVLVLGLWEFAGWLGWTSPILLPRPSQIIAALVALVASGGILAPLAHTVGLFVAGYTLAVLIGTALGIAMATSRILYGLLEPLVEILRPIPKPALVPVLFLFLGIGKATMIALVVLAAVFPVLISTYQGVRALDPVLLETARTFHVPRARTILSIILPASLPMILAGMRVALGLGLVLVILAEMLAAEEGIGFRILDLERSFQIRDMFAWIVVLVALGGAMMKLFDIAERTVRLFARVILPATLPAIAAGLRTATSLCLVVAVLSEMIAGSSNIGYYLVETQYAMRPDLMYAAVLYLAVTGYALNRGFLALETRMIPWMGKS